MPGPLTSLDELTPPQWLTEILQCEGHLPVGRVERVAATSSKPILTSTIAFLDVSYSSDESSRASYTYV